ncbi:Pyridoxine-5'-phosphate oxidase, partial [Geodia barretti]
QHACSTLIFTGRRLIAELDEGGFLTVFSSLLPACGPLGHDISQLRTAYSRTTFTEDQLVSSTDPFRQFHAWFQEALTCKEVAEANAVCVSTVGEDGRPSSRMVLMKGYSKEEGFKFYTNLKSRKAREVAANPAVCLLFYWAPLHRQVRIEGTAEQMSDEASARYFSTRPRESQLSAVVSPQSERISSREELEETHRELSRVYSDSSVDIPKPEHWGGFRVWPHSVEFWQGQSTRLHDRIVFERERDNEGSGNWTIHRLAP